MQPAPTLKANILQTELIRQFFMFKFCFEDFKTYFWCAWIYFFHSDYAFLLTQCWPHTFFILGGKSVETGKGALTELKKDFPNAKGQSYLWYNTTTTTRPNKKNKQKIKKSLSLTGVIVLCQWARTHLSLLSTSSIQEDPSWHNWKMVKNQIKQTNQMINIPVFRVTRSYMYLKILVKPRIFSGFLEEKYFYAFWKVKCISKCIKLIFFSEKK